MGKRPLFSLLIALATSAPGQSDAADAPAPMRSIEQAARSRAWLALLHYRATFPLGLKRSEVERGTPFFFSEEGHRDPAAELESTILRLRENPKLRCEFPARAEFIERELGERLPKTPCAELEEFVAYAGTDRLAVVFSSAYPGSPASMFGHTLLRFHREGQKPLLDTSISYAASPDPTDNSLRFALLGIAGGYPGVFSVQPYYMKVGEYLHSESRDLWEYELELSRAQIRTALLHLWELHHKAVFQYYFFDENCAYRLLRVLEAARPDWELSAFGVYAIPSETLKRVARVPGAVRAVSFRPSLRTEAQARLAALSPPDRARALELAQGAADPGSSSDARVLDAAITAARYRVSRELGPPAVRDALLTRRSALTGAPPDDRALQEALTRSPEPERRPDLAHGTWRLALGAGRVRQGLDPRNFGELHFRTAYHDLLNPDEGFVRLNQIEFPSLTLRFQDRSSKVRVEKIGGVQLTSLPPMTGLERPTSWLVELSWITPRDQACESCHALLLEGALGASAETPGRRLLLSGLLGARAEAGSFRQDSASAARLLPKATALALLSPWTLLRSKLEASLAWDAFAGERRQSHFYQLSTETRLLLSREWDVRVSTMAYLPGDPARGAVYRELGLRLGHTF